MESELELEMGKDRAPKGKDIHNCAIWLKLFPFYSLLKQSYEYFK